MFYLLDVNVLIASADTAHEFHQDFHHWSLNVGSPPLATCPLTENGFLRIYGSPSYPGGPGSPELALPPLTAIRQRPGYVFLPDDFSLADSASGVSLMDLAPKHLTDLYLLALSVKHGGRLVTFDTRIPHHRVPGGSEALTIIPTVSRVV
jgi:uncharacterized protein